MIYLINYEGGDIDYVEAKTNAQAKKLGSALHPGKNVWKASVSEVMRDMPLNDWTRLTIGCVCVSCAYCKFDVCPYQVFVTKAPVYSRPCHDEAGNVFCDPECKKGFEEAYGRDVVLTEVRDYDSWALITIPVPADPAERVVWDREWALVPHNHELVYLSRKRYDAMHRSAEKVAMLTQKGID